MPSAFRTIFITSICIIFFSNLIKAQPRKGQSIDVEIGYGISVPYASSSDITGSGFYAQGEYVLGLTKWFGVRPYAGFIITSADENGNQQNQPDYKVTSKAFLLGGKVRLSAPIPWVAPYIEVGIGASIGSFENFTSTTSIKDNGLIMHIPFSLGLAIGRKHNYEFSFSYYFQPSVEQFAGAITLGYSFPLN